MGRLLPFLRLLRIGTVFSPAADVAASAAILGLPFDATVVRAAIASASLYAAGMVWNDIADRRADAVRRPERPLPRGDVSLPAAVALGALLLAASLLVSPCRLHHLAMAALVLGYDFGAKRIVWLGALGMATLRAMNLATAYAASAALGTAVAADAARTLWIACACYAAYIAAVTVLGVLEDEPKVRPRAVAAIQAAPPLAAWCGIAAVQDAFWPAPALALVPALAFLRRNARARAWDRAAIRRSMTWLLLGTMLYTSLLALAADRPLVAAGIAAAILPARWISRRIALT